MAKKYKPLYEIFKDEELQIAEKIQQRRLQMLIHSRLYYIDDQNIISDYKWSEWAQELRQLQDDNPNIAKKIAWAKEFENWDGSSGTFLPLDNEWVRSKAEYIKNLSNTCKN